MFANRPVGSSNWDAIDSRMQTGIPRGTPVCETQSSSVRPRWTLVSEVEQVKQVANRRAVDWGIVADRIVVPRVWQVIAAAAGDRRQAPVVFDEL